MRPRVSRETRGRSSSLSDGAQPTPAVTLSDGAQPTPAVILSDGAQPTPAVILSDGAQRRSRRIPTPAVT
jgi:hypothetical protein